MKKSTTALAVLAAVSATVSGSALAQSSVNIFGRIDVGYKWSNLDQPRVSQGSGQSTGSRIGWRGIEDLGDGTKAGFVLEAGFNTDTGASSANGGLGGRQAYLSLEHADRGTLRLGRQYTILHDLADIYAALGTSSYALGTAGYVINDDQLRLNNALTYFSPDFSGLSFRFQLGTKETDSNGAHTNASTAALTGKSRPHYSGGLNYTSGPLSLALAVSKNYGNDRNLDLNNEVLTQIAGSYDLGVAKLFAQAEHDGTKAGHGVAGSSSFGKKRAFTAGVRVPAGAWLFKASVGRAQNANRYTSATVRGAVTQFALAADYSFSKRTKFYVGAGVLRGDFDGDGTRDGTRRGKSAVTGIAHYF